MKPVIHRVVLFLFALVAVIGRATTPTIIPLPQTVQPRPGIFMLCPAQSPMAAPGHPLVTIYTDAASLATGDYLAEQLYKSTGQQFAVAETTWGIPLRNAILLTTANANTNLNSEGYELTVAPDSVVIRGPTTAGVFYGVQTLLQLLPPQVYASTPASNVLWTVPCVYVFDQPQYHWRGVMLDTARHFITKDQIKHVLDAMAMHKLNVFHWHLTDDQGWRLEITNYPALTTNSAWRAGMDYNLNPRSNSNTNSFGQYGGFYTQAQAREIVAYAQQLHITVVPEIEIPCHATAGLAAYPQFGSGDGITQNPQSDYHMDYPNIDYGVDLYSPGSPGTMAFFEEVLSEVMAIFPSQYIHCGGDEVIASGDTQWNGYTNDVNQMVAAGITNIGGSTSIIAYQHWLSTNLDVYIQSKGRTMIGWSEYEAGGIVPGAAVMDWETGASSQATNVAWSGNKVVMSQDNNCYINYVEVTNLNYEPPFIVGGTPSYLSLTNLYKYNPLPTGLPAQYDTNILGAQCNLWTEYVPSYENVMYKMFPRACAMAEITWTPRAQQSFTNFMQRLTNYDEPRLAQLGVNYNHENIPQIGTWSTNTVPTSYTTWQWNITTNVTGAGEIDVSFCYTNGSKGLSIAWTSLLQNGTEIDRDTHNGFAQNLSPAGVSTNQAIYVLHLPAYKPSATYSIDASVEGIGGTNSAGIVFLPNWD